MLRDKIEDTKKDHNKKISAVYRELEKIAFSIEKKASIDDMNDRFELKADK